MASLMWFLLFVLITPLKAATAAAEEQVPAMAMYVFGDSLVDVGNNNYIDFTMLRCDFPPNGIDYAAGKATGRFSNGKNFADFVGEKIGLAIAPPPYLSNTSDVFVRGVNFASGGCGLFNTTGQGILATERDKNSADFLAEKIELHTGPSYSNDVFLQGVNFASGGSSLFNTTGQGFLRKCISMTQQLDYYSTVHDRLVQVLGTDAAQKHLSKSIFLIVMGSNDLSAYFKTSDEFKKDNPEDQYIDQLMTIFQDLLLKLHSLGARKLVLTGIGPLGCVPLQRRHNINGECFAEINGMAVKYNQAFRTMLEGLSSQINGLSYSLLDMYNAALNLINNPTDYGFIDVKVACCGSGRLNADSFCFPSATYCLNRNDHAFWDAAHPNEKSSSILVDMFFESSSSLVTSFSLNELIAM